MQNRYDQVLYPGQAFPQTHPGRLAALAILHGMWPAPVESCRVLELGCGDGSNIIPMAFSFPGSTFTGVDLSSRAIEGGDSLIKDLGLTNIRLLNLGIEEINPDWGLFDYVIAHGVYSWVPQHVRQSILKVCQANMAENGVAYISYNTMPGGHMHQMVREMLRFHVRTSADPNQQVDQALALLNFLSKSKEEPTPYTLFLQSEVERVAKFQREHLFHDTLAEINEPFHFHEFISQAAQFELQFLSEADLTEQMVHGVTTDVKETLKQLEDDPIGKEQYGDFVKCRRFRQTLLCHSRVALDRKLSPERAVDLYFGSPVRAVNPDPAIDSPEVVEFVGPEGREFTSNNPIVKAAMLQMGQICPAFVAFNSLFENASSGLKLCRPSGPSEQVRQALAEVLVEFCVGGIVEVHACKPDLVPEVSDRPEASRLSRVQLKHGNVITNQRHLNIKMDDELGRNLLELLDGRHDKEQLLDILEFRIRNREIKLPVIGKPGNSIEDVLPKLPQGLDSTLSSFARYALLVN